MKRIQLLLLSTLMSFATGAHALDGEHVARITSVFVDMNGEMLLSINPMPKGGLACADRKSEGLLHIPAKLGAKNIPRSNAMDSAVMLAYEKNLPVKFVYSGKRGWCSFRNPTVFAIELLKP